MSPATLGLGRYLTELATATDRFATHAARAGLDAPVPSCPEWTVRELLTHQGMVHRWARAMVLGDRDHDTDASEAAAASTSDLLGWFADGAAELGETLAAADPECAAPVFLNDPPTPLLFWARRQAHETTVHAVDAQSAALGRLPDPAETGIAADLAADGADELLTGFITRAKTRLRSTEPYTVAIECTDRPNRWTVRVSGDPPVTRRQGDGPTDAAVHGTALEIYLGLWNRYLGLAGEGRPGVLAQWREQVRVLW